MIKEVKPIMGEQYYVNNKTDAQSEALMADKPVKVLAPDEQKMVFGEETYPC